MDGVRLCCVTKILCLVWCLLVSLLITLLVQNTPVCSPAPIAEQMFAELDGIHVLAVTGRLKAAPGFQISSKGISS